MCLKARGTTPVLRLQFMIPIRRCSIAANAPLISRWDTKSVWDPEGFKTKKRSSREARESGLNC